MNKYLLILFVQTCFLLNTFSMDRDTITTVRLTLADPCQEFVYSEDPEVSETCTLTVYPNPGHDIFNIQFSRSLPGASDVLLVTDLQGRIVFSGKLTPGMYNRSLDLSPLPPGIYFLAIKNDPGIQPVKLVIL